MFLDEPIRLLERMDEAEEEYRESLKNREAMEMEAETAALSQVFSVEEVTAKINRRYGIDIYHVGIQMRKLSFAENVFDPDEKRQPV